MVFIIELSGVEDIQLENVLLYLNVVKNISEYSQKLPNLVTLNAFRKYSDNTTDALKTPADPKGIANRKKITETRYGSKCFKEFCEKKRSLHPVHYMSIENRKRICRKKLNDHSQWAFHAEAALMLPWTAPQTNNIAN